MIHPESERKVAFGEIKVLRQSMISLNKVR